MPAKKSAAKAASKSPAKKSAAAEAPVKKAPATKAPAKKAPKSMPYEQGKWAHAFTPRTPGEIRYWLIKSEPDVFSYQDLEKAPKQSTCWDSVRNSSARNFMRDGMKKGDLCFYYHSNADPSGIAGVCEVVKEGYPDHTAWDPKHDYFDPKSDPEMPTWFMVDVKAVKRLPKLVSLDTIKATPALSEMALVRAGRLSVVPVTPAEWKTILKMGGAG
jgi:predicted RNA-binding protein with PUA-like domain